MMKGIVGQLLAPPNYAEYLLHSLASQMRPINSTRKIKTKHIGVLKDKSNMVLRLNKPREVRVFEDWGSVGAFVVPIPTYRGAPSGSNYKR
jgi:hypothetical protein